MDYKFVIRPTRTNKMIIRYFMYYYKTKEPLDITRTTGIGSWSIWYKDKQSRPRIKVSIIDQDKYLHLSNDIKKMVKFFISMKDAE